MKSKTSRKHRKKQSSSKKHKKVHTGVKAGFSCGMCSYAF